MNTLKRVNSKVIRLSRQLPDGDNPHTCIVEQIEYTGCLIGDIPNQYNHWFNYKGLTYIIS